MKKSGRPTISANPRPFVLAPPLPIPIPSPTTGPLLLPAKKLLVGVLWVLLISLSLLSSPGRGELRVDSVRSSSCSASPWIHAAISLNLVESKEKPRIARRSRCVERAINAYTRLRPRAVGSGMRNMYAIV